MVIPGKTTLLAPIIHYFPILTGSLLVFLYFSSIVELQKPQSTKSSVPVNIQQPCEIATKSPINRSAPPVIEVKDPIINEETFTLNFTNEGGVEGTTRFLKNITGMWLLEQCLKEWKKEGITYAYEKLVHMAESVPAFQSLIDPDHVSFANPASMTTAIVEYCNATNQRIPSNHAEFVRCIFESLSLKYKFILGKLISLAPFPIEKLHVIGGGSKNPLLNQWTANAIGLPVIAGPSEATAIGNIMIQSKAAGCVESLQEMRQIIRESVQLDEFLPENNKTWEKAYIDFLDITQIKQAQKLKLDTSLA